MRPKMTRPYAAKSGTTLSDQYLIGYSLRLLLLEFGQVLMLSNVWRMQRT